MSWVRLCYVNMQHVSLRVPPSIDGRSIPRDLQSTCARSMSLILATPPWKIPSSLHVFGHLCQRDFYTGSLDKSSTQDLITKLPRISAEDLLTKVLQKSLHISLEFTSRDPSLRSFGIVEKKNTRSRFLEHFHFYYSLTCPRTRFENGHALKKVPYLFTALWETSTSHSVRLTLGKTFLDSSL